MSNEQFRLLLVKYFRNGCLDKSDKLQGLIFSSLPFYKNAKKISDAFNGLKIVPGDFNMITHEIEEYPGKNRYAKKIADFLKRKIEGDLVGAYVHSSVATSEEVSYSDFDGFVILKNEALHDATRLKKIALALHQSEKIMLEMDPLQHHGWFILTEIDLRNYPEYYFPNELIRYAKCLFGENKITLRVKKTGFKKECTEAFNNMALGILTKLESKSFLKNYYVFKNLLSEFMLLPAFYIQAKTGFGIFKKFSFDKVKEELKEKYAVMDEISLIRTHWDYQPSAFYRSLRNHFRLFPSKYFSGSLPPELKNKFDDARIQQMKHFVIDLKLLLANELSLN